MIMAVGVAFLSSCSTTGTLTGGSDAYGYYDNMYYHACRSYSANASMYQRPTARNGITVLPQERKNVRSRENVRRREIVSPNSRSTVNPTERRVIRTETPSRRGATVAPPTRNSSSPARATRRTPDNNRSRS